MSDKRMICCAVTGAGDQHRANKAVPVTPSDIAAEALAGARAGAAVVHIHVRDPATGAPSMGLDLYREVVEQIRAQSDVIINLTTGVGARFSPDAEAPARGGPGTTLTTPEQRVAHVVELRPEICSLDIATMNFGANAMVNVPDHLRRMARIIADCGVKPELEVFDLGHIHLAKALLREGEIAAPPLFQLCLGVPWGAEADASSMLAMRNMLPPDATWGAFGVGRSQFPSVAAALCLGGHVRVGLEDNIYIRRGELASGNAQLVERAAALVDMLGFQVATPAEARQILGLPSTGASRRRPAP